MTKFFQSLASLLSVPGLYRAVSPWFGQRSNQLAALSPIRSGPILTEDVSDMHWPHRTEWEKCEKRLALSAMPWGPLEWDPVHDNLDMIDIVQHSEVGGISHHDFYQGSEPGFAGAELETFLSSAHQQTGWNNVRSQFGLTGQGQTVAIIDSGIAYNHLALGGGYGASYRVVGGWDFAENDSNPFDDAPAGYHGTHVAGIVGANQGSQQGVAPNVDFVALRTFTDTGQGQMAWVESALQWVYDNRNTFENPITTVNLSLGAGWNSSTVPSWATLEEELMRLNQVGIVVVASAGNSFQQNPTPGLAYPAASPHVIPVASVDVDGSLSGFSQRDSRVIAAPGRNISSTVPDHFWGADGVFTDWARASGTSMAAPYVSGASVLIREAMELVGMENINTQSIYNTLMSTANSVFDPITNQTYKSLDLDNAIASILPVDDIGGTLDTGRVQSLEASWRTESWLNTLGDTDVLRINATKSGALQFQLDSENLSQVSVSLLRNGSSTELQMIDGAATVQIVAGETIGFLVEDGQSVGKYGINWNFAESTTGNGVGSGGSNGDGASTGTGGASQNLGVVNGSVLTITGTGDPNEYELDLRQGIHLRVGTATQSWSVEQVESIVIDGGLNNDSIKIIGTVGADKIELRSGVTVLTTDQLNVELKNIESVQFDGVSGPDRAFMYDQATDDRLVIHPNRAELVGVGYNFLVDNVNRIFVHAVSGGDDQAYVYDSNQNDVLSVRPQFTSISGAGFFNYLSGFERVFAYSTGGGLDRAMLYDSVGDDLFNASPAVTSIVGSGFSTFVRGFSEVEAIANAGGNDRAVIHYSGESQILSSSDTSGVINNSRTSIARFFEQVQVSAVVSASINVSASNESQVDGDSASPSTQDMERVASEAFVLGPVVQMDWLRGGGQASTDAGRRETTDFEMEEIHERDRECTPMNVPSEIAGYETLDRIRLELVEEKLERLDSLLGFLSGSDSLDEQAVVRSQIFAHYR